MNRTQSKQRLDFLCKTLMSEFTVVTGSSCCVLAYISWHFFCLNPFILPCKLDYKEPPSSTHPLKAECSHSQSWRKVPSMEEKRRDGEKRNWIWQVRKIMLRPQKFCVRKRGERNFARSGHLVMPQALKNWIYKDFERLQQLEEVPDDWKETNATFSLTQNKKYSLASLMLTFRKIMEQIFPETIHRKWRKQYHWEQPAQTSQEQAWPNWLPWGEVTGSVNKGEGMDERMWCNLLWL